MREGCAGVPRRLLWLLGFAMLLAGPAEGAEQARRRRNPRRTPPPQAAAPLPAPPPPPPQIDGPPPPSRLPGLEPAPVPRTGIRPPPQDRQPHTSLDLGVPTPPAVPEGQTFRRGDPSPDTRQPPGFRLPSPGATLRLPF